ncbi:glycoside hydrolase family 97 C-terminal domain-containing protein [Streptomyces antimycoticus]|uniref:glycoside hydrolase family 97 C-terminal domain-containing protein n=1 Tax=Streptomyces antimycoticus TaxID=68175 RepID=UPI001D14203A|nr:glycoside hydrolase family 97 C-terminal domain-containing protein [Streptomyces antimycoticus]
MWDETHLVDGDPGDRAVLARRSGDSWYLGAITSGEARTLDEPLSFLGKGGWRIEVWKDGPDGKVVTETHEVTRDSRLSVDVPKNGGFAAKLTKTG